MNRKEVFDNNCITRIEEKCINCGMCKKTCDAINNFFSDDCINCGQCILTCPAGALVPKFDYQTVLNYINDTDYTVVAFVAPSVRVTIGDEFGFPPGEFLEDKLAGALKSLGFDYVFDTTFGADLTIMEEANELYEKIKGHSLPMYTSCCPAWVLYMNKYHPDDIKYLSSCKSPIAMQSAMIKTYFSNMYNIDSKKIIAVSINPCTAKKYERTLYPDTDISITTRELVIMLKQNQIDLNKVSGDKYDELMSTASSSGLLFGTSGGVCEAVLRTVYYMLNKKKPNNDFYILKDIRGEKDFKEAIIDLDITKLKVAVINKISTVEKYYDRLKNYDFVEVMECPGGCIGGGGNSLVSIKDYDDIKKKRMSSIYEHDLKSDLKNSYLNPEIQDAYSSFINKNRVDLHTK